MKKKAKGVPTQRDIARRLSLDVSTVNKILRNAPGPAFNKDTARRVWAVARELGYDFERLRHQHRRRHARRLGRKSVTLAVYRQDGTLLDLGRAVLVQISRSGARLDHVRLPKESLPLKGFVIGIRILDGYSGELHGRLARVFEARQGNSIAIQFRAPLRKSLLEALEGFMP